MYSEEQYYKALQVYEETKPVLLDKLNMAGSSYFYHNKGDVRN